MDLDQWSWSSLPTLGGSGFYANAQKIRITGLRLAPPTLEVDAYILEKLTADETLNPSKPPILRRDFAGNTYRLERSKERRRHSSKVRGAARELRRLERERLERESKSERRPRTPEVAPDHLRYQDPSKSPNDPPGEPPSEAKVKAPSPDLATGAPLGKPAKEPDSLVPQSSRKTTDTKPPVTENKAPADLKPLSPKPAEAKPSCPKHAEAKPPCPKPTEAKPSDPKPTDGKPPCLKPTEAEKPPLSPIPSTEGKPSSSWTFPKGAGAIWKGGKGPIAPWEEVRRAIRRVIRNERIFCGSLKDHTPKKFHSRDDHL